MTDREVIKALECIAGEFITGEKMPVVCNIFHSKDVRWGKSMEDIAKASLDFIHRQKEQIEALIAGQETLQKYIAEQKAEIERAEADALKMRRKALLEAASKFAGHSDYHGDTILCKLICMAEGKEVKNARPLDTSEIKAEAIKEFAERLKKECVKDGKFGYVDAYAIDNLVKEMVGEQ